MKTGETTFPWPWQGRFCGPPGTSAIQIPAHAKNRAMGDTDPGGVSKCVPADQK